MPRPRLRADAMRRFASISRDKTKEGEGVRGDVDQEADDTKADEEQEKKERGAGGKKYSLSPS